MDTDREYGGQIPLPGFGDSGQVDRAARTRDDGIRRVRRMSNWTAAALIVGTGAATAALPAAVTSSAATGARAAVTTNGTSGPQVTHSVATTSGSGVTVTTTHTANGKTVVTPVRHSTYQDN